MANPLMGNPKFNTFPRHYLSQLKQDKHFIDACVEYGLSSSEGMNAIYDCYKIGKEYDGTEMIVWRREQGYDSES